MKPLPWIAASVAVITTAVALPSGGLGKATAELRWRPLAAVPGAVDVVGPRADGRLVVAGRDGLFLMRRNGSLAAFARGKGGYTPARGETYLALGQGRRLREAGCAFRSGDVYALDPVDHPGVIVVSRNGRARRLLDLPAGHFLSGIAIDTVGRFGYRLLVASVVHDKTSILAIDCRGRSRVVVRDGPRVEGGLAVAPATFGRFGGRLIGVDEASGLVYAFGPRGKAQLVARSGISVGQDIGVESVGFVPPAFGRRGRAYLADLGAPGSPTTGSDSVLSLAGGGLVSAGVRPGDLIVAAEASGVTITVRCRRSCTVQRLGKALDATHAEGHIAFSR